MIPATSSGALWTPQEDERLRVAVLSLALEFEGRSLAAVLSRIERNKMAWCRQEKENARGASTA